MSKLTGLYQSVNESAFHDAFTARGRAEQFSHEARSALYEHLEQLSEEMGEAIELDVIALCCEYSEYANLAEFQKDYDGYDDMDDIRDATMVIPIDDEAFIIQQF